MTLCSCGADITGSVYSVCAVCWTNQPKTRWKLKGGGELVFAGGKRDEVYQTVVRPVRKWNGTEWIDATTTWTATRTTGRGGRKV